ncbi:MAG: hypothetical protein DWI21_03065 [Planctomycetota bacterium]|nr:MAG: hypothetical protein DWI21_03065 [Planctomycetota bacterium]
MKHFWFALFKGTCRGSLAGFVAALLAGGFASASFGQPFIGAKGADVFLSGVIFPGLFIFGPYGTAAGAGVGASCVLIRKWKMGTSKPTSQDVR